MSAEPLTEEELARVASLVESYERRCGCLAVGNGIVQCARCEAVDILLAWASGLLATIRARDEEIARLREERDAAKASALALHHTAFPQA